MYLIPSHVKILYHIIIIIFINVNEHLNVASGLIYADMLHLRGAFKL